MPHSDLGPRARLLLTSERSSSMCALTLKGDRGATFLHGFLLDVLVVVGVNLHVPLTGLALRSSTLGVGVTLVRESSR
jgi:hypothetical protein